MRLNKYIINEGKFTDILTKSFKMLSKMPFNKVKKTLADSWENVLPELKSKEELVLKILNSKMKTNFHSLDQITKSRVSEEIVTEDWKHFKEVLSMEAFPTLSFYPALTAWMEIGKILEPGMDVNWTKFGVYALFWLLLVSGRFIKQFYKWKKDHPDEYYAERPHLKGAV